MRPPPTPPINPRVIVRSGTLGQIVDKHKAVQRIMLPEIQTGLNPNLLANPPAIKVVLIQVTGFAYGDFLLSWT